MPHTVTVRSFGVKELEVTFSYTPGDPGRYTGHPDNRYPAAPEEFDLLEVRTQSGSDILPHMSPEDKAGLIKAIKEQGNE